MNISVSSLVRRLERELEAEKLKSAKLEIEKKEMVNVLEILKKREQDLLLKSAADHNPYAPAIPYPFQPPTV